MKHNWLVRNGREGRTSGAAKQWTLPIHKKKGETSVEGVGFLVNKNQRHSGGV